MINLEQIKLLEAKVAKAIDYIERLTKENASLRQQEAELQEKLGAHQKRIDELEVLFKGFKDDQGQIEEAILATLDKLSQFEKAMEKSLHDGGGSGAKTPAKTKPQVAQQAAPVAKTSAPAAQTSGNDIPDPLGGAPEAGSELEIF